jgi:hypothetical protein
MTATRVSLRRQPLHMDSKIVIGCAKGCVCANILSARASDEVDLRLDKLIKVNTICR